MHDHRREDNFALAILLNGVFTAIEVVGGVLTNSLAILADALHDLGDSTALTIAWIAEKQSNRPADIRRTFGYRRLSLLSALFAASVLIVGTLLILIQAVPRLFHPAQVSAQGMIGLALLGLLFNTIGFLRLNRGESINEKVLSLHLLDDVLGWLTILIGGIVISVWKLYIVDPLLTIAVGVFTLWRVGRNLKETLNLLLQGVPMKINLEELKAALLRIEGVQDVHDMHVWSLDGEKNVFTGHLVVIPSLLEPDQVELTKSRIRETLSGHNIEHSTLELERDQVCLSVRCGIEDARGSQIEATGMKARYTCDNLKPLLR